MSIHVRGGHVLTPGGLRRTDLTIEGGRVARLGPPTTEVEHVVEAARGLVMPGVVNAHTHVAMTLLRGYGDDLELEPWLRTRIWPIEARLTESDVRAGARLGIAEMLLGGTTAFADMYFFENAIAEEAAAARLRCVAGYTVIDFDTPESRKSEHITRCREFLQRWRGHPLVTPAVAPHAVYSCPDPLLSACGGLSREFDAPLLTHCAETRHEVYTTLKHRNARPLAVLDRAACVGPHSVLAHCGWFTKDEVRTVKERGAHVAHCPVSNLKLATGGYCPVPEFLEAGVNVGLGTDGPASNNTLDMFETMKFTALLHKHHRWTASLLPAATTLAMATDHGRAALGLPAVRIEEGGIADLAVLDLKRPATWPVNDPVSQAVYACHAGSVAATIVNGELRMHDGQIPGMDLAKVMEEAAAASGRLTGQLA